MMNLLLNRSIASIGHNIFSPWGLDRSNNGFANSLVSREKLSEFKKTFEDAREQDGSGKVFEFDNRFHSTYYKDEWDGLLTEQKKEFLSHLPKIEIGSDKIQLMPIASYVSEDMELEDALFFAREEVGKGGIFSYHEQFYTTCTQEELEELNMEDKNHLLRMEENGYINILDKDLSDVEVVDLAFQDYDPVYVLPDETKFPLDDTDNDQWAAGETVDNQEDEGYIAPSHDDHSDNWETHDDSQSGSDIYSDNSFHHGNDDNFHEDHSPLDI